MNWKKIKSQTKEALLKKRRYAIMDLTEEEAEFLNEEDYSLTGSLMVDFDVVFDRIKYYLLKDKYEQRRHK